MHSFNKSLLATVVLLVLGGALVALTPTAGRGGAPAARILDPLGFDPSGSLSTRRPASGTPSCLTRKANCPSS